MPFDAYGHALRDYFEQGEADTLWLNNSYGNPEKMPVEVFFRDGQDLTMLEISAMSLVRGKVLDVGAGAGAHALLLQEDGFQVTAIDQSAMACEIMREWGVHDVIQGNIFQFDQARFDTLWLMMNGIGIVGTLDKLTEALRHMKKLLHAGGQIILDSSDIRYLYENDLPENRYFGEIDYQYVYKGKSGEWFSWLYVDQRMLKHHAGQAGFSCRIVYENKEDQYLALLTME